MTQPDNSVSVSIEEKEGSSLEMKITFDGFTQTPLHLEKAIALYLKGEYDSFKEMERNVPNFMNTKWGRNTTYMAELEIVLLGIRDYFINQGLISSAFIKYK